MIRCTSKYSKEWPTLTLDCQLSLSLSLSHTHTLSLSLLVVLSISTQNNFQDHSCVSLLTFFSFDPRIQWTLILCSSAQPYSCPFKRPLKRVSFCTLCKSNFSIAVTTQKHVEVSVFRRRFVACLKLNISCHFGLFAKREIQLSLTWYISTGNWAPFSCLHGVWDARITGQSAKNERVWSLKMAKMTQLPSTYVRKINPELVYVNIFYCRPMTE